MRTFSATDSSRPPWQNARRLRQVFTGLGVLVLVYLTLVFIAFLGGPRIGASFLPLPGGGPDPANPVAGLEPSQPTQNVPTIPRGTTPAPGVTPTTTVPTPLPTATTPGTTTTSLPTGIPTTSDPTLVPGKPTTEIVDERDPTIPPATKKPPTRTTQPPTTTTKPPTTTTKPPPTTTTPTTPPTTPEEPEPEDPSLLGGLIGGVGGLLDKLGL